MGQTGEIFIAKAESASERDACFAIRREVFIEEQKVPEAIERDAFDDTALHFLVLSDQNPIGAARVVFKDNGLIAKIGRVAVRKDARGKGIGAAIMRAIETCPEIRQVNHFVLEAQTYAVPFYERLGYVASGDEYMDAGIPHRFMRKENRPSVTAMAV